MNNVQDLPRELEADLCSDPSHEAIANEEAETAKQGEIYNQLRDAYMRLYQIEGTLKCAIPSLEHGSAPAIDTVYLVADLVGEVAEKLDLLSSRI